MKTFLLTYAIIASILTSFAQTQIPNGDFEDWSTVSNCTQGTDSLNNFFSAENFIYYNNLISTNNVGYCPDNASSLKSTDKQSGNYALRLGALTYSLNQIPYYFYNFVTLGTAELSRSGNHSEISSMGIRFTGRPTKLTGYYKFIPGVDTDSLNIIVGGYNTITGDSLFYGQFITSSTQSTYQKFEIVLNYNTADQSNPILLFIGIIMGSLQKAFIDPNTVAFIDNLVFEYDNPTTSTINYTSTSSVNVYAANKNINFSENVSDVHVVDMVGAQKMQETATTKTLNAASLTTGLYIVTYKYNDAYFSKKVVIE